jgi:hypothetical protein
MKTSHKKFARLGEMAIVRRMLVLCLVLAPLCVATAQQGKNNSAKRSVAGRYEGTAKNRAEEVINVTFDLTEKEGAMSGMIRSDHGDFTVTGGTHHGEDVTLEFDAGGPVVGDVERRGRWRPGRREESGGARRDAEGEIVIRHYTSQRTFRTLL